MQKEIEIDWNGEKRKVVIRQIDFVTRNKIMDNVAVPLPNGTVFLKPGEFKTQMTLNSIVSAPFDVSVDGLKSVDIGTMDMIYDEIETLNVLTTKKKESS